MTQLDGSAVQAVAELARAGESVQEQLIGSYHYATRKLERVDTDARRPASLEFYTLEGFARFVENEPEAKAALIHVVSPVLVTAVSKLEGQDKHIRREFARAAFPQHDRDGFEFNDFASMEDLTVALQTMFADSPDLMDLQKFCSQVRQTSNVGVADDGVSQTVEARRGVAAVLTTPVKNPWKLALYRTFSEVEQQPVSAYVLRFRSSGEGSLPYAALFETGDMGWRVAAVERIARWLRVRLADNEILG